MPYLVLN